MRGPSLERATLAHVAAARRVCASVVKNTHRFFVIDGCRRSITPVAECRRRVDPRFMLVSQRRGSVVEPCWPPPWAPAVEAFAIERLRIDSCRVEPVPHPARIARVWEQPLAVAHEAQLQTRVLPKTTSSSRVVRPAPARHMDHSPTAGQVSNARARREQVRKTQACKTLVSKTPALTAQVSGSRRERRGGWTFTLRTCPTDFPRFASLPSSMCTVTSMRVSLGSCQGEQRQVLYFWRAGAPTRGRPDCVGVLTLQPRGPLPC